MGSSISVKVDNTPQSSPGKYSISEINGDEASPESSPSNISVQTHHLERNKSISKTRSQSIKSIVSSSALSLRKTLSMEVEIKPIDCGGRAQW